MTSRRRQVPEATPYVSSAIQLGDYQKTDKYPDKCGSKKKEPKMSQRGKSRRKSKERPNTAHVDYSEVNVDQEAAVNEIKKLIENANRKAVRPKTAPAIMRCSSRHFVQYEGERHFHPRTLPHDYTFDVTEGLHLGVVDNLSVEISRSMGEMLKRLDLSAQNLRQIEPEHVEGLIRLEVLKFDNNSITEDKLPKNFNQLIKLQEISARNNHMKSIPPAFSQLKSIKRLFLENNKLADISKLAGLKDLRSVNLNGNRIKQDLISLLSKAKYLTVLAARSNLLTSLSPDVRQFTYLQDVDLSENKLSVVSSQLFLLPNIQSINLRKNLISYIPIVRTKTGPRKHMITTVDLSENQLNKLPDFLIPICRHLDCSKNNIKAILGKTMNKLRSTQDAIVRVVDNPLITPPYEICVQGLPAILRYYQDQRLRTQVHRGTRVLVMGPTKSGKTSLVATMQEDISFVNKDLTGTIGVEISEYMAPKEGSETDTDPKRNGLDMFENKALPSSKMIELTFCDMSGYDIYKNVNIMLVEPNSIVILAVSLPDYKPEKFEHQIAMWIDWVISRNNEINLIIVGTKTDLIKTAHTKRKILEGIEEQVNKHLTVHCSLIDEEINKIKSMKAISASQQQDLTNYIEVRKVKINFGGVIATSCANKIGFAELKTAVSDCLEQMGLAEKMIKIPDTWLSIGEYLDYETDKIWCTWREYEKLITIKYGLKHMIIEITEYLHDSLKVLWFKDDPLLGSIVILKPKLLFELINQMISHTLCLPISNSQEDIAKSLSISKRQYSAYREEYVNKGILEVNLLKCLWSEILDGDLDQFDELLKIVITKLQFAYEKQTKVENIPSEINNRNMSESKPVRNKQKRNRSKQEKQKNNNLVLQVVSIAVPSIFKYEEAVGVDTWPTNETPSSEISVKYGTSKQMPDEIGQKLQVWTVKNFPGELLKIAKGIMILRQRQTEFVLRLVQSDDLTLEIRLSDAKKHVARIIEMWKFLVQVLNKADELFQQYRGLLLKRFICCPRCKNGSFKGEWQTPRELQSQAAVQCPECYETVDTKLLIQPKEDDKEKRMKAFMTELARRREKAESRMETIESTSTESDEY